MVAEMVMVVTAWSLDAETESNKTHPKTRKDPAFVRDMEDVVGVYAYARAL